MNEMIVPVSTKNEKGMLVESQEANKWKSQTHKDEVEKTRNLMSETIQALKVKREKQIQEHEEKVRLQESYNVVPVEDMEEFQFEEKEE